MNITEQIEVGGKVVKIETGKVAKQADGAVMVSLGDTVVLAACAVGPVSEKFIGMSFVPLTVDYREKTYAAGRIPGGFFKREGKPREKEVLTSRLIDRSIRPLLSKNLGRECLVHVIVLSSDGKNDSDIPSLIAASTALMISSIPFAGPLGAVRAGYIDGEYVINPEFEQNAQTQLDMVVSGKSESILMVEAGGKIISEDVAVEALEKAHIEIKKICDMQKKIAEKVGKKKLEEISDPVAEEIAGKVKALSAAPTKSIATISDKQQRNQEYEKLENEILAQLKDQYPNKEGLIKHNIEECLAVHIRENIISKGVRVDGRGTDDIRKITAEIGILPRTHGSSLFTRGETQSLSTVTLGTAHDMQIMDDLEGEYKERFMLHYNFPGFATGEPKADRGPGRREIGHGALAKRALYPIMPDDEEFPYTTRVVSEILESNGSSSMASVCAGSLALFDAGVPVKTAVAGIAMGLITDGDKYKVLTDIMGLEDHYGDMDFKAAGTAEGLTALQMDIKVGGLSIQIIKDALVKAKAARLKILDIMNKSIAQPKAELSSYAPRIEVVTIPQDKIGALIGPGGKNIRRIIDESQAEIEVDDDGRVFISSDNPESMRKAREMVESLTAEVEIGKIYNGKVVKLAKFGAFVELIPGKDGLLHISQISKKRVEKVEDVLKEGDPVKVKVLEIDSQGKVSLSCKDIEQ